jgi:hypothetical protein
MEPRSRRTKARLDFLLSVPPKAFEAPFGYACKARVSTPLFAKTHPQAWRSI